MTQSAEKISNANCILNAQQKGVHALRASSLPDQGRARKQHHLCSAERGGARIVYAKQPFSETQTSHNGRT